MAENGSTRSSATTSQAGEEEHHNPRVKYPKKLKVPTFNLYYWFVFVIMLLLTLVLSLVVVTLLLTFNVLHVPGPVLMMVVYIVTALIIGTVASRIFLNTITKPVLEMSEAAQRMAEGDFDIELKEKTLASEISQMSDSFTKMAHELSETEMLRSDFISNVSHEMKTPLAAIEGYATLLQDPDLSPEDRAEYADKVLKNTKRLTNLTSNILLLSQLENTDKELERQEFSLDEDLREAVLMFEDRWGDGSRELDIDLEEVTYLGNKELLDLVWQNLIDNALKFTGEGDTVSVRMRREEAGGEEPARVVVEVADTGIGMDPSECKRIFEKFYQADRSHATEGNGLGLALAKRIVELHDGTITAESAPGEGSTFTVALPEVKPEAEGNEEGEERKRRAKGPKGPKAKQQGKTR